MPKRSNKRKRAQVQVRRPQQKKKRRRVGNKGDNRLSLLQQSVIDPCNGPLVNGIYGSSEGLMARLKVSYSETSNGTDTAGMLLWVPSYHNGVIESFNVVRFSFADSSTKVDNTTQGLGKGAVGAANGKALPDPANSLLNSDLVNDARTTAACLRLTYTGKVTESSGQIAWIDNYSTTDLLKQLPSVDNMFDRATKTERLGLDTYEVLFRPDDATGTDRFRAGGATDPGFVKVSGGPTEQSRTMDALAPKMIGFAYRGCEPGILDRLIYSLVKTVEWRPETASGLTGVPPQDFVLPSTSNIVASIDNARPGWSKRIASGASSAAKFATSAWTGLSTDSQTAVAQFAARTAYSAWNNTPMYPQIANYAN